MACPLFATTIALLRQFAAAGNRALFLPASALGLFFFMPVRQRSRRMISALAGHLRTFNICSLAAVPLSSFDLIISLISLITPP